MLSSLISDIAEAQAQAARCVDFVNLLLVFVRSNFVSMLVTLARKKAEMNGYLNHI